MYKDIPYPYSPQGFTMIGTALVACSAASLFCPSSLNPAEILMFSLLCFFTAFLHHLANLDVEYENKMY